ncbi:hypothetical protein AB0E77_16345 [Streptomyces sp. NPDC032940]|uniref:hypothetical protein n=1 Tax=Streptomyces sp. NPDC032940 TaxID=3155366 RepID=UPI0033D07BFD
MRTARTLLATAAASAVLVLGAPGAYAAGGDWDHDDSSYSKEQDNGSKHDEPRGGMHTGGGALTSVNEGDWGGSDSGGSRESGGEKSWGGEQEKPHGGMHTGGGALTAANEGDWGGSGESGRSGDSGGGEKSWGGDEQEKPHGGMHTGGGGLAEPGATAGGLAVLGVAATGLYAARRRKSAHGAA